MGTICFTLSSIFTLKKKKKKRAAKVWDGHVCNSSGNFKNSHPDVSFCFVLIKLLNNWSKKKKNEGKTPQAI